MVHFQRLVALVIGVVILGYIALIAVTPAPDNRTIQTRIYEACYREFSIAGSRAVQECEGRTAERIVDDMERRKMERVYHSTR